MQIVFRDFLCVCDNGRRAKCRQSLRNQVPAARQRIPFLPLSLQAIDVQRDRNPAQARPQSENRIRGVAIQRHVDSMKDQVNRGEKCVRERVEVFVTPGGKINELDTLMTRLAVLPAAVNDHAMPARHQTRGKLFGERLESSVAGWDAARAEDRDARRYSALAALDFARARAGFGLAAGVETGS